MTNDLLCAADASKFLILLDLSAAFDTVDHMILLDHVSRCVGISGSALDWFNSFISNISFIVSIGSSSSTPANILCGVLQGSVLGSLLLCLYILPLRRIIHTYYSLFTGMQMILRCICSSLPKTKPVSFNYKTASKVGSWLQQAGIFCCHVQLLPIQRHLQNLAFPITQCVRFSKVLDLKCHTYVESTGDRAKPTVF